MSDKKLKVTEKEFNEAWKDCSYVVMPDGYKRMTFIGFLQAV